MRKLTLFIAAISTITAGAQTYQDTISNDNGAIKHIIQAKKKIDRLLDKRDDISKQRVDTNYMQRLPQRIKISAAVNAYGSVIGSEIKTNGNSSYGTVKTELSAQMKYTTSLNVSYRGLSLGFSVNPAHLKGENKDYEFNMNAYGRKFGADFVFQSAKTFKGTIESNQNTVNVPPELVKQDMFNLNGYYIFNSRRFSYPAAFSQSWIQKRSAGSFMLGVSFSGGRISTEYNEEIGTPDAKLDMLNAAIGIGYGYNLALRNKWLLHLSTIPEFIVYSHNRLTNNGETEKMPYSFPNVMAVGRIAVVRHFTKYYLGLYSIVNVSNIGDRNKLQINNMKWRAKFFVGIKL